MGMFRSPDAQTIDEWFPQSSMLLEALVWTENVHRGKLNATMHNYYKSLRLPDILIVDAIPLLSPDDLTVKDLSDTVSWMKVCNLPADGFPGGLNEHFRSDFSRETCPSCPCFSGAKMRN